MIKNIMTHENYKNTRFEKKQSFLSCYYDKQCILSEDTKNLTYKHKGTELEKKFCTIRKICKC